MIRITKEDINSKCGYTEKKATNATDDECLVVFGVMMSGENTTTAEADEAQTLYNFIVYKNFMKLQPFTPAYGFVQQGDYRYFLFKSDINGTLMISLTSYMSAAGSLELLINQGMDKWPTLSQHDYRKETAYSDVITISPSESLSTEGYWIIGVYAKANSTFQVDAGVSM